jgi:hypothetical protein
MMRTCTLTIATLAVAAIAGSALAGDIYRYTDAEGNISYVDRPTGAPTEERVPIVSKPTDPAQVQARAQSRFSQGNDGGEMDEDPPTRAERAEAERQRAEKCQQYRDQLETYLTSRRLYRETGNGERQYLDDNEILEARSQAEELVVEYCD